MWLQNVGDILGAWDCFRRTTKKLNSTSPNCLKEHIDRKKKLTRAQKKNQGENFVMYNSLYTASVPIKYVNWILSEQTSKS